MPGTKVVILRFGAPAVSSTGLQVAFKFATYNMLPAQLNELLEKTSPKVVLSTRRKNISKPNNLPPISKSKTSSFSDSKQKTAFPTKTSAALTQARYSEISGWEIPQFSGGDLGESQLTLRTASGIEGPESSIEIQFKTVDNEGVLLYASTRRNDIQDFLLIGLKEGSVVVWFDMGQGVQRISSGFKVVGDQWHVLAFHRTQ